MNTLDQTLRTGLKTLIRMGRRTATLPDGSSVRGILEALSPEETAMLMQGGINAASGKHYTFQTVEPLPQGFRTAVIDGQDYAVTKCQPGQGCYISTLTMQEMK